VLGRERRGAECPVGEGSGHDAAGHGPAGVRKTKYTAPMMHNAAQR
jgi:hypothetical protein